MNKYLLVLLIIIMSSVTLWGAYSGTGTFEKIADAAALESGAYYVFYGSDGTTTGALKNTGSGSLDNAAVSLTLGKIESPATSIVWLVTGSTALGYTVYNEAANVFVEIKAGKTTSFSLNSTSSHTYEVSDNGTNGIFFKSNHASSKDRGISLYNASLWRCYYKSGAKKLELYKLTGPSGPVPPTISNVSHTPATGITSSTTVSVSATVTVGDAAISEVKLKWGIALGSLTNTINMAVSTGTTYVTASNIQAQADEATVYYEVYAKGVDSAETTLGGFSYAVQDPPAGGFASDLFFSEYIEGGSSNKALEIYNGTGAIVDLTKYKVKTYTNGSTTATYTLILTGTLAHNNVYVIGNSAAASDITSISDIFHTVTYFNGDDAVVLEKDGTPIDIIGVVGVQEKWAIAGTTATTENHTLVRKSSVSSPTTNWATSAGTTVGDSQWEVYPVDTFTYLGSHVFGSANTPPTIANIVQDPAANIISTSTILVTADVTDSDGTISEVKLHWGTSIGSLTNNITMVLYDGSTYMTDPNIPDQLNNTTVYYQITAKDNDGAESTSGLSSYTVANLKADFTANRTIVSLGQTVTFTSTTTGGVKPYTDYLWDFGDDTEDSIELSPTHSYSAIGKYTVTLYVGDTAEDLVSVEKVNYIEVVAAFINPAKGTLYISEVSDAPTYTNEYIELYNNSADVLSLENIIITKDETSRYNLNDRVKYFGDRTILPHNYIIITRTGTQAAFETEFTTLPAGVTFLQGDTNMFFGTKNACRWQVILNTRADGDVIIDDTLVAVGGENNTSYQITPDNWVYTSPMADSTPGAPHEFQTLPVTLSSFMAVQTAENFAKITWTTESESSLTGYNVYRSVVKDQDTATRVNSTLIVAENSSQGSSYNYVDEQVNVNTTYYYWLQINEFDGSASFHGPFRIRINENNNQSVVIPLKTTLRNVYPNPFNPTTSVSFYMDRPENIKINIYNIKGQLITNLLDDSFTKGFHEVMWNGKDVNGNDCASGVYFFRMETRRDVQIIKGILMK